MLLSHLIPSLSVWNVWDLPAWAWSGYRHLHDDYVEKSKEGGRGE